jgi:hypothetical protein
MRSRRRSGAVAPANAAYGTSWQILVERRTASFGDVRLGTPGDEIFDEVIPLRVETALHNQWCARGATSQQRSYFTGHALTQVVAQSDVVSWLNGRLAGAPAPSNC